MNLSAVTPALGWILVRPGVVCGVVKDKVRFHCHLCLKDMTELSREEKHQHLHSYHRDETVVRQKPGVSEDFPGVSDVLITCSKSVVKIEVKNVQEWNPSLLTKDDLSENYIDPGSLRGDGLSIKVEEGVGKKYPIDDDGIGNPTSEHFGEIETEILEKPELFPCYLTLTPE